VINIPIDSDFWTHVYCQYLVEGAVKHTHAHKQFTPTVINSLS